MLELIHRLVESEKINHVQLTGFAIDGEGALTPLAGSPFVTGGITPQLLAASRNLLLLFVVNSGSRDITVFRIEPDGSLTTIGERVPTGSDGFASGIAIFE